MGKLHAGCPRPIKKKRGKEERKGKEKRKKGEGGRNEEPQKTSGSEKGITIKEKCTQKGMRPSILCGQSAPCARMQEQLKQQSGAKRYQKL